MDRHIDQASPQTMPLGSRSMLWVEPSPNVTVVDCARSVLLTTHHRPLSGQCATSHSGFEQLQAAYRSSLWLA